MGLRRATHWGLSNSRAELAKVVCRVRQEVLGWAGAWGPSHKPDSLVRQPRLIHVGRWDFPHCIPIPSCEQSRMQCLPGQLVRGLGVRCKS